MLYHKLRLDKLCIVFQPTPPCLPRISSKLHKVQQTSCVKQAKLEKEEVKESKRNNYFTPWSLPRKPLMVIVFWSQPMLETMISIFYQLCIIWNESSVNLNQIINKSRRIYIIVFLVTISSFIFVAPDIVRVNHNELKRKLDNGERSVIVVERARIINIQTRTLTLQG